MARVPFKGLDNAVATFEPTPVSDADYSILKTDRLIAITALTAVRTITLPAPVAGAYRSFQIKDQSGAASIYNVTVDTSGASKINGKDSVDIRSDYQQLNVYTDGVNYFTWDGAKESGQVKINTGNSVKPSQTWIALTVGDFLAIEYDHPLGLSSAPTTTWPRNTGPSPTDSDIYDDTNETFVENTVPGQPNSWRMIFDYSGKSSGNETGVEIRIRNLLSGFVNVQIVYLPSERTSGQFAVNMITIADGVSLPTPWGTGQGYVFDMAADDPITIEVDSITRINAQVD